MLRVHGFYGHVRLNDLRSLAMFAGFLVAFQIVSAVALFPPLLLLDTMHAPLFPQSYLGRYGIAVAVVGVAIFLLRFSQHVASVRATVDFAYVDRRTDPRLVNMVESLAIAAGLPLPKVGLIESPACNAFACGLSASSAVVVVTRGLLDALDDDELGAVVAHEIAHIKNGDIRLMAAANVLMENLYWVQRKSLLRGVGWKTAFFVVVMPALLMLFMMAGFFTKVAFTIARVSRLLISSSREFVADAEAVRLTHNPGALISALRRIEGRSAVAGLSPQADAMMIDGAVEGPTATHPSIAERITVLARLSGSWAEADRPRRDTRTTPSRDPSRGPWGSPEPAAAEGSPARLLVQRVNAGSNETFFTITTGARWIVNGGLALIVGSGLFFGMRMNAALERSAPKRAAEMTVSKQAERLSAMPPAQARCFATERYSVGDRGLKKLNPLDPKLVDAYVRRKGPDSSGIVPERTMGWREQSVRAVAAANYGDLDAKLAAYVTMRKTVTEVMHRFYGEPGLRLVLDTYDSRDDRAVLDTLRRRLRDRAPALIADGRIAAEMEFLVSAPDSFIPCVARALQTRP